MLADIERAVQAVPAIAGAAAEDVARKALAVEFQTTRLLAVAGGPLLWNRGEGGSRGALRCALEGLGARVLLGPLAH